MMNESHFLNHTTDAVPTLMTQLGELYKLLNVRWQSNQPIAPTTNANLNVLVNQTRALPIEKTNFADVLETKLAPLLPHMVDTTHPFCAAHLHCPSLLTTIVAENLIAACNLSMDSWDQSGVATLIEQQVIGWLCQLLDYPIEHDGVFTSGGTQSNLMGVLLAREAYAKKQGLAPFNQTGLQEFKKPLILLCTSRSHFSVVQAARWLGIGSDQVLPVDPFECEQIIEDLMQDKAPFIFVATAGCTDFGNIDPLPQIRMICDKYDLWMHVDAAVGGALLLTKYKYRLQTLQKADSVTIDFHKLFFQPISASAFIVKNKDSFKFLNFYSDYLNRQSDELEGTVNLVGKSLQTTRRFDALKIWLSWQHLGLNTFQQLIENLIDLTQFAANFITEQTELELAAPPSINTVVFRLKADHHSDDINRKIRRDLFNTGQAIIGETVYQKQVYLKLTLMNPEIEKSDVQQLIQLIIKTGIQSQGWPRAEGPARAACEHEEEAR